MIDLHCSTAALTLGLAFAGGAVEGVVAVLLAGADVDAVLPVLLELPQPASRRRPARMASSAAMDRRVMFPLQVEDGLAPPGPVQPSERSGGPAIEAAWRGRLRDHAAVSDAAPLHPLVAGFTDADTYERGRPPYDERTVAVLREGLGLRDGAPLLELGPGTGQLSRVLVAAGFDLRAVEPLPWMREALGQVIGPERVLAGTAEDIPLDDDSVDAVVAADSFHWFDETRAMPEIHRVLRPGGGVAISRSFPSLEAPWSEELGAILLAERPTHPAFGEREPAAALEEDAAFEAVNETSVTSEWTIDRDGVLAFMASVSWVGTLPAERRAELLAKAAELLDRHEVGEVCAPVTHRIWMARLI
jgi:SAM-dependent methyltransferase